MKRALAVCFAGALVLAFAAGATVPSQSLQTALRNVLDGSTSEGTSSEQKAFDQAVVTDLQDVQAQLDALEARVAALEGSPPDALWQGDHEEGDLSDWFLNGGGGEYNDGAADATVSADHAHGGAYSAKLTVQASGDGTRLFRWGESRANRDLVYSAWFYVPGIFTISDWSNWFQFKSRSDSGRNDPIWALYVLLDGRIRVGWGWGGGTLAGPFCGDPVGGKWYTQPLVSVPAGQWFKLEARLIQSTGSNCDGSLIVSQDGVELFRFENVFTGYPYAPHGEPWGTNSDLAVNNYGSGFSSLPFTVYIDDAEIRRP